MQSRSMDWISNARGGPDVSDKGLLVEPFVYALVLAHSEGGHHHKHHTHIDNQCQHDV